MNVKDFKEIVGSTTEYDDMEFHIEVDMEEGVFCPGSYTRKINSMMIGFDWDSGKFILGTKEKLKVVK